MKPSIIKTDFACPASGITADILNLGHSKGLAFHLKSARWEINITEPRFAQNPEHSKMQHVLSLPILPVLLFIHSSIFPTGFILPNLKALALQNYQCALGL